MKYFILKEDKNYIYPSLLGWYKVLDRKTMECKKFYEMPKHLLFYVEEHMQMIYTDIIMSPCFMVSDIVKKTIELYNPFIKYSRIILFDKKRKKSMAYYIPFLQTVDCIIKNNVYNSKKQIIQIEKEKVNGQVLIRVLQMNQTNILIRLDLIESILRRGAIGIGLEETEMIISAVKIRKQE